MCGVADVQALSQTGATATRLETVRVVFNYKFVTSGNALPTYFKIDKERRVVMSTVAGDFTLGDGLAH